MQIFKKHHSLILWSFLVGLLLSCAFFLRTYRLANQGLLHYDEGKMVVRAFELRDTLFTASVPSKMQPAYVDSKMLWLLLIILGDNFLHLGIPSAQMMSMLFGMLTIVLTYALCKKYYKDQRVALTSAVLLSFSPLHVLYSRMAWAESAAAFFSLLAVYLYCIADKNKKFLYFLSGIIFGLAFLTNRFRVIFFVIYALILAFALPKTKKAKLGYLLFLSGTIILIGSYMALTGILSAQGFPIAPLWENLATNIKWHSQASFEPFSLLTFFYYIFRFESVGILFLLLASPFFAKSRYPTFPFFVFVLIQIFFGSLIDEKSLRTLSVVLPFIAITCSATLINFSAYLKKNTLKPVFLAGISIMLATGFMKSFDILQFNNDLPEAVRWIKNDLDYQGGILSTNKAIVSAYAPQTPIAQLDARLIGDYRDGFHYMIMEPSWFLLGNYTGWWRWDANKDLFPAIRKHCQPLKIYENYNRNQLDYYLFEYTKPSFKNMFNFTRKLSNNSGKLFIYEVGPCIENLKTKTNLHFYIFPPRNKQTQPDKNI